MKLLFRTAAAALLLVASAANAQAPHDHESVWTPEFPFPTDTRAAKTHTTIPLFGNISSLNFFNFYGEVAIGTPPQKFKLLFDTRQPFVSIPNFEAPASQHAFYDHNSSSTFEPDGTRIDAFGGTTFSYIGFYSRDTIRVGDLAASNVSFVEVTRVVDPPNFDDLGVDGVFGLGPGTGPSTGPIYGPDLRVSVLQRLVGPGEPVFTLYFNKNKKIGGALATAGADEPTSAGELTIGAIDKRRYTGGIHYVNTVADPDYQPDWKVMLDAVTVSTRSSEIGFEPGSAGAIARIQSAFPFIAGPKSVIEKLAKEVGADGDTIDCSSNGPDVVFHIGGVKYTLTKDDYTLRDEGSCRWPFLELPFEGLWLIGQPFLQKFYTVYEFGDELSNKSARIGFALAA